MKPKEFFDFIPAAIRLKRIPVSQLNAHNEQQTPVIVSLTSIPSRLRMLHYTVRSLMVQTYRPEKIILWLNESLKNEIPKQLSRLVGDLFEIRYSSLICSHRKLIHSLESFPDSPIATCDDDMIYPNNWLALLYNEHLAYPNQIIANRCAQITFDAEGRTLPYKQWLKNIDPGLSSMKNIPIGCDGVFYPEGALSSQATDSALFLKLAPHADDLWFKAMSFINGTLCRKASVLCSKPKPVPGTRGITLAKTNVGQDKNRAQWNALADHFEIDLRNVK